VSITAQIARIQAAHPQAIISWATTAAGATVFRALIQAGIDLPTAASGSNMTYGQMTDYAAFLPKQLYFGVSAWAAHGKENIDLPPAVLAEQKKFFTAMSAAGLHADASADIGWDPARIVMAQLNKLPPGASAAQLHNALIHLTGYAGIDGIYDFVKVPQRGLDINNAIVVRWDAAAKDWLPVSKLTGIPLPP
jgi:branched-chain amino acid transport system substrate-binding protein